jgi:ribonuclease P/MRP protein subunit POP7
MPPSKPPNLLSEGLSFEKKNKPAPLLPPNTKIRRRPLTHAPVASPYAGASIQKVVYVSRSTPIMAAVKRVKKLLLHIEKRAMQGVDVTKGGKAGVAKLAQASEKLGREGESVLVKGSGRAMEQALRVGEWFRTREEEMPCKVEVKTGSVQAVDDLVEGEDEAESDGKGDGEAERGVEGKDGSKITEDATDPMIERKPTGSEEPSGIQDATEDATKVNPDATDAQSGETTQSGKKRQRRGKRKRAVYDKDDMPEARARWINTVEIAISLRG